MVPDSTTESTAQRPSGAAADRDVPRDDAAAETTVPRLQPTPDTSEQSPRSARLHELVLEARVAALEQRLEHKERELQQIRSQYEAVLSRRNGTETADGDAGSSWLPWD